jgi:hypothetical protein
MPLDQENIQRVASFEMMALWVAAGYGVGAPEPIHFTKYGGLETMASKGLSSPNAGRSGCCRAGR